MLCTLSERDPPYGLRTRLYSYSISHLVHAAVNLVVEPFAKIVVGRIDADALSQAHLGPADFRGSVWRTYRSFGHTVGPRVQGPTESQSNSMWLLEVTASGSHIIALANEQVGYLHKSVHSDSL